MVSTQAMAAEEKKPEQFVGILAYRTGPFAAGGSGWSSGKEDFMALINARGGINGKIMYKWEECETAYNTERGVECYNRFRDRMAMVHPLSTGITYALIPKATEDKIVLISGGYGRADAAGLCPCRRAGGRAGGLPDSRVRRRPRPGVGRRWDPRGARRARPSA